MPLFIDAIRGALRDALLEDERVFLLGEDIGHFGGAFGVTKGLWEEFGEERVIDTPISEEAVVGAAVGAAWMGDRLIYLRTHADAVRWNARLPCSGTIVSLRENGSSATATFRLGNRKSRQCADPPGAEAIALFVVEHGKIILWDQIGSQLQIGH